MSQRRKRKDRKFRPGMKVFIIKDCRENGAATDSEAIYEGRFIYPTNKRYKKSRAECWHIGKDGDIKMSNPRLRLPDNSTIWGIECWFTPIIE